MTDLSVRADRIAISEKKSVPPFSLDVSLTSYCPQENLDVFRHPQIRAFHQYMRAEYEPPATRGDTVLLLMPCTKTKPYCMSKEHLEINGFLFELGYKPERAGGFPPELFTHLPDGYPRQALGTAPLVGNGLTIHRMIVSEPMGLVAYEDSCYWRGELSPAARYDDPGLFESRGTSVCPWRADNTARLLKDGKYAWGPAERAAFVGAHNYLSELIADTLARLRPRYRRIVAYVSPKLTHRSFLTDDREKKDNGMPLSKRTAKGREHLVGVNQRVPGLVDVVPSAEEFKAVKQKLAARLSAEGRGAPGQVSAYFAGGGGAATPLILPEALEVLERHVAGAA